MAKKPKPNKTQAVRDYLKDHPGAMNKEIATALTKQGIKITPAHVATIKTKDNQARNAKKAKKVGAKTVKKAKKPAAVVPAVPSTIEKPKNGDTITLEQIKKVAQTIKSIGGFHRVLEVLEVIKGAGGVKKFKELAEAMTATDTATDDMPF